MSLEANGNLKKNKNKTSVASREADTNQNVAKRLNVRDTVHLRSKR